MGGVRSWLGHPLPFVVAVSGLTNLVVFHLKSIKTMIYDHLIVEK